MKKLLIISTMLLGSLTSTIAQTWMAMDTGLYYATGLPGVYTIEEYNNELFAGGSFMKGGGVFPVYNIAQWNGSVWDSVGQGLHDESNTLTIYNGTLISGAGPYLSQWNGSAWSTLGPDTSFFFKKDTSLKYTYISSLITYNGNLIAGGSFDSIPGMYANNIAYWNGSNWNTFGTGFKGRDTAYNNGGADVVINTLAVYNGNLYAAGYFSLADGKPMHNIAMWNGFAWTPLGTGVNNTVNTLTVYNGNLYAAGSFDTAGGMTAHNIAVWNGSTWSSINSNPNQNGAIFSLASYNSILYAGGFFDTIGGVVANSIAYWDGSNWHPIGKGVSSLDNISFVYAIYSYNNNLYIGGLFDSAGGVFAQNIAMCSNPTGIDNISNKSDFSLFPNPNNGQFTIQWSVNSGQSSVEVYNMLGEQIFTGMLRSTQGDNNINLGSQPNGVYFYRLIDDNGALLGNGKFIIAR